MRAVRKNLGRAPAVLAAGNLAEVLDTTDLRHKEKIRQYIYGHETVVRKLKTIYRNKCAYCESYEPEPEVEHFRPKRGVTGLGTHPGYYWLCYEWSNLMPACHDCNKKATKGNYFPVEGPGRVTGPTMLGGVVLLADNLLESNNLSVTEVPLILNPERTGYDPFYYFKINEIGKFEARPQMGTLDFRKAEKTIIQMRLNRDKLFLNVRKRQIYYYMGRLKAIAFRYLRGNIDVANYEHSYLELLREIDSRRQLTDISEHWFFWNYFFQQFKWYISQHFKARLAVGLINTYDAILHRL